MSVTTTTLAAYAGPHREAHNIKKFQETTVYFWEQPSRQTVDAAGRDTLGKLIIVCQSCHVVSVSRLSDAGFKGLNFGEAPGFPTLEVWAVSLLSIDVFQWQSNCQLSIRQTFSAEVEVDKKSVVCTCIVRSIME